MATATQTETEISPFEVDGTDRTGGRPDAGLWSTVTRWLRTRPLLADAALMLLLAALSVAGFYSIDERTFPDARDPDLLGLVLMLAAIVPVAWRRRAPIPALFVSVAATVPYWVLNYMDFTSGLALFVLMYSVGAYVERPNSLYAYLGAAAVLTPVMLLGVLSSEEELTIAGLLGNIALFTAAWALGENLRSRRAYLRQLEIRTEALEREQSEAARRAADGERRRIARELHDVIAHSMSVMVVQAGAARRVIDTDPATAGEAMSQVEQTGREAMTEMRRMLGVLRDEDTADPLTVAAPQPGLADLGSLVASTTETGLHVDVVEVGEPGDLPPGVDLSAYRIIQEALTNTIKHAAADRVEVRVARDGTTLTIDVVDDGRGAASSATEDGSGHGLVGMRERAALLGGTVSAGPRAGGGFAVHAVLPIDVDASDGRIDRR